MQELQIRKYIPDYNSNNPEYPTGICNACQRSLNSKNGDNPRKMNFPDCGPAACTVAMVIDDDNEELFFVFEVDELF